MRRVLASLALLILAGCGVQATRTVQQHHARQFTCDSRYVEVDDHGEGRYVSAGCGILASWDCVSGVCTLRSQRAWGTGGP